MIFGWSLVAAIGVDCLEGGDCGLVCFDGFLVFVLFAMECALPRTAVAVGGVGEGGELVLVKAPDPAVFAVM